MGSEKSLKVQGGKMLTRKISRGNREFLGVLKSESSKGFEKGILKKESTSTEGYEHGLSLKSQDISPVPGHIKYQSSFGRDNRLTRNLNLNKKKVTIRELGYSSDSCSSSRYYKYNWFRLKLF